MSEGVFLDANQQKFLSELDKWLKTHQSDDYTGTIEKARELITKIETKGYYNQTEADILNELRSQYVNNKKKNK